ncbi:Pectate lyase superfamily protein [compost metagenome]
MNNYKKKLKKGLIILLNLSLAVSAFAQKESKIFEDYKKDRSILPDFSYVGYHNGEKKIPKISDYKYFNVTDFGAKPNDGKSDKVAIQLAIDAANKNGSGIVFFPKGRFLVNEESDLTNSIISKKGHIIFRGSGSGTGGTELYMKNALPPADPAKMWTVPPLFNFSSGGSDKKIGEVVEKAVIGDLTIKLSSTEGLEAGDWIILKLLNNDKDLLASELKNYKAEPQWTYLVNKGIDVKVFYQIKKISQGSVTLNAPIAYTIEPKYKWDVYKFANSEEVGIEDIAFVGNWTEKFVHHASWKHDSGFTMLNMTRATNSWIKNCRFTDCSVAATIAQSANISVLNCKITGNAGHQAINSNGSTNVLIANCVDEASQWHSFGSSHGSMNTVIWKCAYPATTCFESHSSQPRNTLLDNVQGGLMNGRAGGATENMPNHMQGLVLWNYKQTNEPAKDFEFWPPTDVFEWWKILSPTVVGFTSKGTTFKREQIGQAESLDKEVAPGSLYLAQLELRLGKLPKWVKEIK